MSGQAAIRAALTAFYANPDSGIPNVSQVLPEWPTEYDPAMFNMQVSANQDFGCMIAIHLADSQEHRVADPVIGGSKMREHNVGLLIYYQYLKPEYPPAGEPYNTAWVNGLDQIIDGILAWTRSDPTGGTGVNGAIWQMGQDMNDMQIIRDLPRDNGATIISFNRIDLKLTEYVQA